MCLLQISVQNTLIYDFKHIQNFSLAANNLNTLSADAGLRIKSKAQTINT